MKLENEIGIKKRFCLWLTFLFVFIFSFGQSYPVHSAIIKPNEKGKDSSGKIGFNYVPGEILVKFKEKVLPRERDSFHAEANGEVLSTLPRLGVHRVKGKGGESTQELLQRYKNNPLVEYAEPNVRFHIQLTPNDPRFGELYGLHNTGQTGLTPGTVDADIDAPEAWDLQTGSGNVIVADIDTGVDYNHPDLAANIWTNPGEIPGNGIDDDGNGYIDDVHGWNFITNTANPMDDHGHGTHTSGTIAAVGNNGVGVVGVAWNAKIMALKFLSAVGEGDTNAAAAALIYAADMGAKVSSNSYSCFDTRENCFSQTFEDAVAYARSKGMIFVVAAGNSNNNNDDQTTRISYPCISAQLNVICVAATDRNDQRAGFSNYGANTVHLGAPGVETLSTVPSGGCGVCDPTGYTLLSGTSMATPHVAGAAALLFAQYPTSSADEIRLRILDNVDPNIALNGLTITGGRLNIDRALRAPNPVVNPTALTAADRPADSGGAINLAWTPSTGNGITQQRLYRSTTSGGPFNTPLITFNDNTTSSYTDTGLADGTRYYYVIRAFNGTIESGNSKKASAYPINNSDTTPPIFSNIYSDNITSSVGRITWTTNEVSDSQVEYGQTTAYGGSTPIGPAFVTSHSVTISNLIPSTVYHFRVKSRDVNGNLTVSGDSTFTTLPPGADGTWTTKPSMPVRRNYPGVGVINNILYVVGDGFFLTSAYDPTINTTDAWSAKEPMITARYSMGVGVLNGLLYAAGGNDGGFDDTYNLVERFDPLEGGLGHWRNSVPMRSFRYGLRLAVVNNIIYAVGGYDASNAALTTVEAYDPAAGTWSFMAPMPTPRGSLGLGVVNGILYAVGGYNGSVLSTVEAYDPATNTWTTKEPLSIARSGLAVAVENGIMYAVGGETNEFLPLDIRGTVESYNPADDSWAIRAPMPTARGGLAIGVINGLLYAVGGHDANTVPLQTVEAYTPFLSSSNAVLTVVKSGTGTGTVTSNPAGINCGLDCSEAYNANSQVTLTAAPDANSNFTSWGGCDSVSGTSCTVSMTAAKTVTATFTLKTFTLTVTKNGTGSGTVSSNPAGINCGTTCVFSFNSGTPVTLTAAVVAGSGFAGFTGGCVSVTSSCNFTITANTSVTVTFNLTTGPKVPTAAAAETSSAGDGNGYEVTPGNVVTLDGAFAADMDSGTNTTFTCTDAGKDKHRFYNYNFSFPAGAVIKGITVGINAKVDSATAPSTSAICVQLSWNGGTSWTTPKATSALGTTVQAYLLGGPLDTWGRSWNVSELNNTNFRVRIIDVSNNNARDFFLDRLLVQVDY